MNRVWNTGLHKLHFIKKNPYLLKFSPKLKHYIFNPTLPPKISDLWELREWGFKPINSIRFGQNAHWITTEIILPLRSPSQHLIAQNFPCKLFLEISTLSNLKIFRFSHPYILLYLNKTFVFRRNTLNLEERKLFKEKLAKLD